MTIAIQPTHDFTYDGAVLNVFHANKGEGIPKHDHIYSHLTFCSSGKCIVRVQDKEIIMDKTTMPINLSAGKWHEIEALEDETVFINVFSKSKR